MVDNAALETIHKLTYLAINKNEKWNPAIDIKIEPLQKLLTFVKLMKSICSHDLSLRISMVKCSSGENTPQAYVSLQ